MDHMRLPIRLAVSVLAMACLNGCDWGAAHADIILDLNNASPTTVVVRWTGSTSGYATLGPCRGTRQGLDAGDYTIAVGDPPRATFPLHVAKADPSGERGILIRADGTVVTDAKPDASLRPCRSPSVTTP